MRVRLKKKPPILAGILLIVVLGVVLVFRMGIFNIKTLLIEGDQSLFEKPIAINTHTSLLFIDTTHIIQELSTYSPWIKNIQVIKKYPWTLIIKVTERIPIAQLFRNGEQLLVSEEGMILPLRSNFKSIPAVRLDCSISPAPGQIIDDSAIVLGLKTIATLHTEQDVIIESLRCVDSTRYQIVTSKTTIEYGQQKGSDEIASSLQVLFRQFRIEGTWPKRVDLRFDKPLLVMEEYAPPSTESAMPTE